MDLHNQGPNQFGDQDSAELQDSSSSAPAVGRGATQVLVADQSGVVVLPAGTELGDIRIEGRDLVVIGADGVRYVIPDGAIIVPQLVIDDVVIPPLNLAALLIGNEPQPAAGNPQSSGGNFASAVGPLQAAYGLGDLLPYTELAFPQPEEREIIPDIVDREPTTIIITPDNPTGATAAGASVSEAGLPGTRLNGAVESPGSNASASSETTAGSIVFVAEDGLTSITLNGTAITAVGQQFTTPNGVLTITSIAPGNYGYSYTLTDNTNANTNPTDVFVVVVTDSDGDTATANLTISIVDDAPDARADTDAIAAGTYGPETGNVISGSGTTSGAAGADVQGADGARVTSISGTGGTDSTLDTAGNLVIAGQYGTLTINPTGSYSYVRTPNTAGGVTDVFTYTLTDGDGDSDTATLTISIADSPASVVSLPTTGAGTVVDEAGLPARTDGAPGTAEATPVETTSGTITVVAPDGIASVKIGETVVTGAGQVITVPQGSLTITSYDPTTGAITYSFTLTDNTTGDTTSVSFPVTVTDVDGDSDTKTLTITILDDAPIANDDSATQSAENVPVTVDVLGNDIEGADSVQPGTVTLVPGTLSGSGQLVNNGDGTFTYTPGNGETGTVTFDYTITDGDGDSDQATVTLTLAADSTPTIAVAGDDTVDEAALPARTGEPEGSNSASTDETAAGTIALTTGGDTVGTLVVNGVDVTAGGTVTTAKGTLTVSVSGGAYSYSYTLTDNTLTDPDSDAFTLVVTDSDGDAASTTLIIAIADDQPTAADDAAAVAAGTYGPIGGNVVTNDTQGADAAEVVSYSGVDSGAAGSTVKGLYGTLTIAADGTFSYTRNAGTPGDVTDTFTYTIEDGDGDQSSAQLVITIGNAGTTLDLPIAGTPGVTQVLEAGLNPDGSDAAGNGEFASGSFTFTAPDGPAIITIDGIAAVVGQTYAGAFGTLTITAISAGSVDYTYELTTSTVGDSTFDDFAVVVSDQDGDNTAGTLQINIVDDVPTATDDTDAVAEDGPLTATGNVITGNDGTFPPDANATDGVADVKGADGATVTAIEFNPTGGGAAVAGTVAGSTAGAYGTLTLNADGSYSYALDNANPLVQGLDKNESLTETFTYTLTDGDTDADTATLTITINGTDDGVTITGLNLVGGEETVFENDLADGSSPAAANLTQTGSFTVTALDGIQTITVGGTTVFSGGSTIALGSTFNAAFGTLTITSITPTTTDANGDVTAATIGYSYTLNDNTLTHTGPNGGQLTDSFAVTVTDTDGSIANDSLDVVVIDDVPTANPDGIFSVAEATPFVIDALTNDTNGADGVNLATGVVVATNPSKGTVVYNGDGTFTYTPNAGAEGPDSFTYTITDDDGDPSTTTVTLDLLKDSVPVVKSTTNLTVDEDGLAGANVDAVPLQANPAEIDGSESTTATGTAVVNFGADVPVANLLGSIVLLDNAAYDTQLQTLDGNAVTFAIEGGVLIGRDSGGAEVIRVTVTGAALGPTTGDVTYTYTTLLSQPVKHAIAGSEDTDTLSGITFRVTDSETDTATGTFSVSVLDDVPSAETLAGATFAEGTGTHDVGDAVTVLGIVPGADGLQGTLNGIVFTNGGATGGTLSINGAGRLIYTSPTNVTSGTTVTETFTYTVTDRDGDSVTRTVTFGVSDTGITNPAATSASVDEDNIGATGNPSGLGDLTTPVPTGTISYTKGADAITGITLSTGALGFTKLDGTTITTSYNAGTGVLTGHAVGNPADVVFTVTLGALGQTSTGYTVTLLQPIQHTVTDDPSSGTVETAFEDDKTFTVNVVITDADNSTANTSFSVLIDDDTPVAGNLTGATFAEGTGVHDIGAAASLLGISAGADGLQGTLDGIVFTNGGATGGTLSINGAGRLIYTSPTNVTSGTTVTETFTYTVTDRDGDSVTRTVTFGVSDTGITNPAATSASIDEDDIGATGNAGGPDDLTTPVPTGTISYTKGADAITGITLSTGALGFTKLDGTPITTSYDAATGVLTGFGTGPADVVFTVTLGALGQTSTGYTVTLLQPIRHTVDGTEDDKSFTVNAVIADADNSTANTSFTVTIDDDTPVLADVIGGGSLVLDETGGFDTVTSTTSAIGFTANFGADGVVASGATIYTIERTSGGGATALKTAVGDLAISLVQTAPNVIKGQYNDGTVKDAFIVTINTDGTITVQQLVALEHNVDGSDAASYDDPLTLDGLITARVQITDRDGDSTSATTQIGDQITFRDDGLSAAPDTKSVAEGAVVNGNVLTDNPDTFGTDGPDATTPAGGVVGVKAGSDVSVPVTTGTGTVIETSLGFLTLNANGTYTYDSKGNTVGAAAVTDTFVYTIRDADGDTSTTTLTITINPVTLAGADQTVIVNEAALDLVQDPADLAAGTVTGSQPALGTETVTGTLTTTGATGAVTYTPQMVSDALGNFVLNADGTYKYTLKAAFDGPTLDNGIVTHPAVRTFNYTVTDASGNTDTGTITINVIDDVPVARADTDSVTEESAQVATGNVIDGVGTTNSPASIDTAGADGAAVTGVAFGNVAGPVAGSVGSLIDTPLGSLTLLSGGGYTYTLDNTNPTVQALGATEFLTETFTYTITDGDGDTSTTTLTIRINGTNDAPTITAASNAVSEEGLPGGIADTIGTSPSADTTNSKTATGTVVVSDIDGDALSVTFGTPATALTSGGVAITWALSDGGKTLTGSAGATPVIVATITNGGVYNVELTASIDHPDNIGTDPATFEDALNLVIPVSVSDGTTTVTNANGLTISIEDDSPVPVSAASSSLINAAGQSTTASLDTVNNLVGDNFGGDGAGKIIFTDATVAALQGQGLTSGSAALTYVISNGGQTITAEKQDGTDVFVITLQPAGSPNSYTVQMFQKLDSFEDVTFDASQVDVVGGNGGWAGYVPSGQGTGPGDAPVNDNSLDLLVTPMVNDVSTSTINTNANEIGVGGNFVDLNEGVRVDFVVDLTGTPVSGGAGNYSANPGNRAHTFDQHYDVNGASALFTAINTSSTVTIIARDDNNTSPGGNDTNDLVGDGTIDNITKVAISYNGASLLITEAMWIADADKVFNVGGQNFTVAFGVNDATVSGVVSNTRIAAFTDSNYSSIEFKNTGGDDFKIGLFSASRIVQEPVPFTAPISITDRDGDTVASGSLSIIATPSTPPVVLDLDGDGAEFLSLAAGVHYDYAGDGAAEATAWVGSDDGILAYDANGNGRVDGGAEFVFGSERVSDLEGVAARFDENGDGILNAADGAYGLFGVWQDANSDGIADEGEFLTLSQAGIASITLTTNDQASSAANGSVRVQGTGTFTRADGSTGSVADAAFATKAKDSQRTAELVTTAAVAGAIAQAAPLAAQPALAENHATLRPEAAEITRVAEREASNSDSRSNEVTIDRTDRDPSDEPTEANAHIRGETAEARIVTDDPDFDQDGPAADYLATADGQAGGAGGSASLFASMGTEGLMDGLLTMGQPQFAHGQLPEGAFALAGNVLGDFAGEAMIDGLLDHFAPMGQGTVFAMTSLDGMADLLSHDLGGVGGFAMMAMPEANDDASMLAAAQA